MTDYEKGYAEALADCRRTVETELEYPSAKEPGKNGDFFKLMSEHPREAVALVVAETKKSLLRRMPRGDV